ncbi:MAG TPA: alpha/beta hydrolase [Armatimonadota bacterium]|jgi:pimeloyl-ACP methyl ester carboxylesterase
MTRRFRNALEGAAGLAAGATACAAAANAVLSRRAAPLPPAIDAEQGRYDWDGGAVSYSVAGRGKPIVLLHSHNAAASTYEMKQAFQRLKDGYRVFAPDLPGYGRSERRHREYFAHTYIRFLHDFVSDVVGAPAIVVAASLSASHAILAAAEDPGAFSHLVLASPTGISDESADAPEAMRRLSAIARVPVWGQAAFNALASKASIRWFYENRVYDNPWAVTHEMVDYAWLSAHQPRALYAPASFLNGNLWGDPRAALASITAPALLIWGAGDRLNPYAQAASSLPVRESLRVHLMPECGGAAYDEKADEFAAVVRAFLAEHGAPPETEG